MSQAFSARESGCSSCSVWSSSLGLAALPNALRVSDCREKPLMRVSIGLGQSLLEAKWGAAGSQGVAAAPGPVPQLVMLWVAVLGKENWKTDIPDPQLVLGRLGVPGGGWCLALEAPWRCNTGGCSPRLRLLGAEPMAPPQPGLPGEPGASLWDLPLGTGPGSTSPCLPCFPHRSITSPCSLCPCLAPLLSRTGRVEPWALLVESFPASSSQEDLPALWLMLASNTGQVVHSHPPVRSLSSLGAGGHPLLLPCFLFLSEVAAFAQGVSVGQAVLLPGQRACGGSRPGLSLPVPRAPKPALGSAHRARELLCKSALTRSGQGWQEGQSSGWETQRLDAVLGGWLRSSVELEHPAVLWCWWLFY